MADAQVAFTCAMMLTTMTVFSYVLGEISNVVIQADEELVKQRSQVCHSAVMFQLPQVCGGIADQRLF